VAATDPADPLIGRELGEFVLREQIGHGAFGAVYRADQPQLGREAVVKVLHARHQGQREQVTRFIREGRLASGLEHPYAAHVYACGEDDGLLWIAMELVRGTPLSTLLKDRQRIPPDELVPFFEKLCEVLQTAHEMGIVHRDVKPANVMVVVRAGRWLPKLLDFGVARGAGPVRIGTEVPPSDPEDPTLTGELDVERTAEDGEVTIDGKPRRSDALTVPLPAVEPQTTPMDALEPRFSALTIAGTVIGSPAYMAPEQWTDPSAVDGRADIYALGACAYVALAGYPAFRASSLREMFEAHTSHPVPGLPDDLPPALDAAIRKAMAKQPTDRFATAMEFATALRDALPTVAPKRVPTHDDVVYPGLRAFTAEEAVGFFGREREAEAFRSRLVSEPLLAVVGPSGSGKTSFVQAGIVAELPSDWDSITVRPGADPPAALAHALGTDPRTLGGGPSLLVVVDQLEELFTQCVDPAKRLRFAEWLIQITTNPHRRVRVVVTLRDDFLVRVEQLPPLRNRLGRAIQILATPGRDELAQILVEPARRAGFTFEDRPFVDEIVATVAGTEGGLALLAFTAARLWEHRDRDRRRLTRAAYHTIGGVGGALAKHADDTIASLSGPQRAIAREAFRRLVLVEGTRATFGRGELAEALGGSSDADVVIERLVDARLLIASEGIEGARVEIAHEVLVRAWPQLVQWRHEDAEHARMLEQLRAAGQQWDQRGRPNGLLWRDEALADLNLWKARHPEAALSSTQRAFVDACERERARARRSVRIAAVMGVVVTAAVLVVLWRATVRARSSAGEAHDRMVAAWQEYGRRELLAGRTASGVAWLVAARREGASSPALRYLLSTASAALERQGSVVTHGKPVRSVAITPDGGRAASGSEDGTAIVWETRSGKPLHKLEAGGQVTTLDFSPSGDRIATGADGRIAVWSLRDGVQSWQADPQPTRSEIISVEWIDNDRLVALTTAAIAIYRPASARSPVVRIETALSADNRIAIAPSRKWFVSFEPESSIGVWDADGKRLASKFFEAPNLTAIDISPDSTLFAGGWSDNKARVFSPAGELVHTLIGHTRDVIGTRFSPDGKRLMTTGLDATVRVWDLATATTLFTIATREQIKGAYFSADGAQILTYGGDAAVRVWDARDGTALFVLDAHEAEVRTLARSATNHVLVTGGWDGTARTWDLAGSPLLTSFEIRDDAGRRAWAAKFVADDQRALTSDQVGRVRIWDLATGTSLRAFDEDQEITDAALSPSGDRIALAYDKGTAVIERVDNGTVLATLRGHRDRVWNFEFSPDGKRIATASWDHTAAVWDATTGARLFVLEGMSDKVWQVTYSRDGRFLATACDDGRARIWDAATGARVGEIIGHASGVGSVGFSPDGSRLVTGSRDRTARIWDLATGHELARLEGHSNILNDARFSPDGQFVLTAAWDGSVRVWDANTGALLRAIQAHPTYANVAAPSADGSRLLTVGSFDKRLKVWRLDLPTAAADAAVDRVIECKATLEVVDERLVQRELPADCR
jgi:WD40 repeat protein/serine/threonine protein kinase